MKHPNLFLSNQNTFLFHKYNNLFYQKAILSYQQGIASLMINNENKTTLYNSKREAIPEKKINLFSYQ